MGGGGGGGVEGRGMRREKRRVEGEKRGFDTTSTM